jgi:hypothetical protein
MKANIRTTRYITAASGDMASIRARYYSDMGAESEEILFCKLDADVSEEIIVMNMNGYLFKFVRSQHITKPLCEAKEGFITESISVEEWYEIRKRLLEKGWKILV